MEEATSDAMLAGRAVEGDRAAFAMLVGRHYDFLFRIAWRFAGDRDDAEDIAQDVCVRLPRALASWSRDGRFESWLYVVVVHSVRDRQRRIATERRKLRAYAAEPREEAFEEASDETTARLWAAVRRLPPKQREAVTLVHGEGVSHAIAARAMGCAEATVSYHVHAARKRLREWLTDPEGEEA